MVVGGGLIRSATEEVPFPINEENWVSKVSVKKVEAKGGVLGIGGSEARTFYTFYYYPRVYTRPGDERNKVKPYSETLKPAFSVSLYSHNNTEASEKSFQEIIVWDDQNNSAAFIYKFEPDSNEINLVYHNGRTIILEREDGQSEIPWYLEHALPELRNHAANLARTSFEDAQDSEIIELQEAFDFLTSKQIHSSGPRTALELNAERLERFSLTPEAIRSSDNFGQSMTLGDGYELEDRISSALGRLGNYIQQVDAAAVARTEQEIKRTEQRIQNDNAEAQERQELGLGALREENAILKEQLSALIESLEQSGTVVPDICKNPEDYLMVGEHLYDLNIEVKDRKALSQKQRQILYLLETKNPIRFDLLTEVYIEEEVKRYNAKLQAGEEALKPQDLIEFYEEVGADIRYQSPEQFKLAIDQAIENRKGAPIEFSSQASFLPHLMAANQIECSSATNNYQVACRQTLGAKEYRAANLVSIYEPGRKLWGRVVSSDDGFNLYAVDPTAAGTGGPIDYGSLSDFKGAGRIVDAELDLLVQVFYDHLKNPEQVRDQALGLTSELYSNEINLESFNHSIPVAESLLPDTQLLQQSQIEREWEGAKHSENPFLFGKRIRTDGIQPREGLSEYTLRSQVQSLGGRFKVENLIQVDPNALPLRRAEASEKFDDPRQSPETLLSPGEFKVFLAREIGIIPNVESELRLDEASIAFLENFIRDQRYFSDAYLETDFFKELVKSNKKFAVSPELAERANGVIYELRQISDLGVDYVPTILEPSLEVATRDYLLRQSIMESIRNSVEKSTASTWTPKLGVFSNTDSKNQGVVKLSPTEFAELKARIEQTGRFARAEESGQNRVLTYRFSSSADDSVTVAKVSSKISDGEDATQNIQVSVLPFISHPVEGDLTLTAVKGRLDSLARSNARQLPTSGDLTVPHRDLVVIAMNYLPENFRDLSFTEIYYGEDSALHFKNEKLHFILELRSAGVPINATSVPDSAAPEQEKSPMLEIINSPESPESMPAGIAEVDLGATHLEAEPESAPSTETLESESATEEAWVHPTSWIPVSEELGALVFHQINQENSSLRIFTYSGEASPQEDDFQSEAKVLSPFNSQIDRNQIRTAVSSDHFRQLIRTSERISVGSLQGTEYLMLVKALINQPRAQFPDNMVFQLKYFRSGILIIDVENSEEDHYINLNSYLQPEALPRLDS